MDGENTGWQVHFNSNGEGPGPLVAYPEARSKEEAILKAYGLLAQYKFDTRQYRVISGQDVFRHRTAAHWFQLNTVDGVVHA